MKKSNFVALVALLFSGIFSNNQLKSQIVIDCPPSTFVVTNNNPTCDITVVINLWNCDVTPRLCQSYTQGLAFGGGSFTVPCADIFNGCYGAKTCDIEVCVIAVQACRLSTPLCVSQYSTFNTTTLPAGCCASSITMNWNLPPNASWGGVTIQ